MFVWIQRLWDLRCGFCLDVVVGVGSLVMGMGLAYVIPFARADRNVLDGIKHVHQSMTEIVIMPHYCVACRASRSAFVSSKFHSCDFPKWHAAFHTRFYVDHNRFKNCLNLRSADRIDL